MKKGFYIEFNPEVRERIAQAEGPHDPKRGYIGDRLTPLRMFVNMSKVNGHAVTRDIIYNSTKEDCSQSFILLDDGKEIPPEVIESSKKYLKIRPQAMESFLEF